MLTIWLHVSQRKRLHLIHVIRIIYEEAHNLNGTHKCQQANMLGQRSHFFIQDKNEKHFICIFLLIPANMVDKSIVRCDEERFDQTLKYSKSNITMHISISIMDTGCQYHRYINESFYYTVRRAKKLLKSFSVRYVATKMFIIKHLTFLLHLHSLYILEISSKFSLIKARLSSCRLLTQYTKMILLCIN